MRTKVGPLELGRWRIEWLLVPTFALVSGRHFASMLAGPGSLGYDARLYAMASRAMIEGDNPWRVQLAGGYFAGPPTSLLPLVPFAYVPLAVTAGIWVIGSLVVAALVLRKIGLPAWWLMFPPLFQACTMGSVDVLMLGLLVHGSGFAAVVKPYAALPLLAEGRWRALAGAGAVCIASLVILPWGTFVGELDWIRSRLAFQSLGGIGPTSLPLIVVGVLALLTLGRRRALWLATPVLMPNAQLHYMAMTIPALPAIVALAWAIPVPGSIVAGVVLGAVAGLWAERNRGEPARIHPRWRRAAVRV